MEKILDQQLEQIVDLYFKGYSVAQAIEEVRLETIQTSRGCIRTN